MFHKSSKWFKSFWVHLRQSLPVTIIMTLLWLLLGWLRSFGIHSILLYPLNFLTGALAGLDGGSIIGGTIGKTLLLLMVNSFMRTLFTKRGDWKLRLKTAWENFREASLRQIPQYTNLKQLFTGDRWRLALNGLGFGMALLGYALLTGNGSFQNSFLCILLFAQSCSILVKQRGLIITAANRILRWLGGPTVDRDAVNRLVSGNALGNFASLCWAAIFNKSGLLGWLGGLLIILCATYLIIRLNSRGKELAAHAKG